MKQFSRETVPLNLPTKGEANKCPFRSMFIIRQLVNYTIPYPASNHGKDLGNSLR